MAIRWAGIATLVLVIGVSIGRSATPESGQPAPDFELKNLKGDSVKLSEMTKEGPVVLVVLRGYPGYQCPICSLQVASLRRKAEEIAAEDAKVILVYPGPSDELQAKAEQFIGSRQLPEGFEFVIDPDFQMVNAYDLRWDAPRETAYPSTFVIDDQGVVQFSRVSKTHAGRTSPDDVLRALSGI